MSKISSFITIILSVKKSDFNKKNKCPKFSLLAPGMSNICKKLVYWYTSLEKQNVSDLFEFEENSYMFGNFSMKVLKWLENYQHFVMNVDLCLQRSTEKVPNF